MTLPTQIQKQLDAAESLYKGPAANEVPAPEVVQGEAAEVVVSEPAQPPAPATQNEPATQQSATPPSDPWEHKYKTLQGIHNHHVGDLKARLAQAEQEREALKTQLEKQQDKPEVSADPKDVETFGADLVDMVKRVAEQMFGAAAKAFDARISQLETHIQGAQSAVQKTAADMFLERLKAMVPDYADINADEKFLEWLAEVDPIYGLPRQAALDSAAQAQDVGRVAKVFLAFKGDTPPPSAAPAATSALEKKVAPKTAASAPVKPATQPEFSVEDVQKFYNDVARGLYRGRDEEAARLEAMFNEALAAGRITEKTARRAAR